MNQIRREGYPRSMIAWDHAREDIIGQMHAKIERSLGIPRHVFEEMDRESRSTLDTQILLKRVDAQVAEWQRAQDQNMRLAILRSVFPKPLGEFLRRERKVDQAWRNMGRRGLSPRRSRYWVRVWSRWSRSSLG